MVPVTCNSEISSPPEFPDEARISKRSSRLAQDKLTTASRRSILSSSAAVHVPRTGEYVPVDRGVGVLLRADLIPAPGTSTLQGGSSLTSLVDIDLASAPDLDHSRHIATSPLGRIKDIVGKVHKALLLWTEANARPSDHTLQGMPSVTLLTGPGKAAKVLIDGNELAVTADRGEADMRGSGVTRKSDE